MSHYFKCYDFVAVPVHIIGPKTMFFKACIDFLYVLAYR